MSKIMRITKYSLELRLQGKEIPEWLQIEEERLADLAQKENESIEATEKLVNEDPQKAIIDAAKIVNSSPIFQLYLKYEVPKRLERYKDKGKLGYEGTNKTGDFLGIEK